MKITEGKRIIECFYNGEWIEKSFINLRHDNIFRIFDDGERYSDPVTGNNVWIVVGEPYLSGDNVLTVNTLY